MQLIQNLAELHTHKELDYYPDDLANSLEYYGARIGRDLGRLHELTEGKITVDIIVEMATVYAHLVNKDDTPEGTPYEFFRDELIPYMQKADEVVKEDVEDDINPTESS